MRLVPVEVNSSEKYHIHWDILATISWVIIFVLVIVGYFPAWVIIFYTLTNVKGLSIKFRLEK